MDVREQILGYYDRIEDEAFARAVFEEHGLPKTLAAAVELASSGVTENVYKTLTFVQDVTLYHWQPGIRDALPTSGLFEALHANLYAPNRSIRHNSVYLLGKLCYPENARLLDEWVRYWREQPFSAVKVKDNKDLAAAYSNRFEQWRHRQTIVCGSGADH